MLNSPLLVILDDKRTDIIVYGPTSWSTSTLSSWFNGTGQALNSASNRGSGHFGTISMKFQGTSVAFFGITPSSNNSQILTVSIDGSEPTNTSYNDPNPPSYRQWYQSPTLTEGSHNISLSHLAGTALDFAVVTAGNNTPLSGQVVIVDNQDPAITFKGNWEQSGEFSQSSQFPDGLPFHNSTHDSTTIGDDLTFKFTGQSAAIYGIFTWSNLGLITLTFTMDGSSLSRTFQVTSTTPQFQNQLGQQQNFQFFSYDFLTPGNHTLVVSVTDCVNQTFSFDYITFEPSFSTLATRPNLTDTVSDDPSSHNKFPAGAIIGIIIVVLLAFLGGVLFSRWRKKKPEHKLINPFLPGRRDAESFPLNSSHLSSTSDISNNTVNNSLSSRYTPVYTVDDTNAHLADGTSTAFVSVDPRHTGSTSTSGNFYDRHVNGEDELTAGEEGELFSPPSYAESARSPLVIIDHPRR